jgi:hypothetical protein
MKEDIFDFDVLARGNFIDNATGGDSFRIEVITLRLNHIAFGEYLTSEYDNSPEHYNTQAEYEQHKVKKEHDRISWKKRIVDMLGLYEVVDYTGVTITEAQTEVFTVVHTERLRSN